MQGRTEFARFVWPFWAATLGCGCGCLAALAPALRNAPSPPFIAFIPRTTGTNFTEDMHRGARAAAMAAGYQVYWNGPAQEGDIDRQISIAQSAAKRGARAIIVGPTNTRGLVTMVNDFTKQRLPVVFVQTMPAQPTGSYLTSVTPDEDRFGEVAAARAAFVMHSKGEMALVGIDQGTPETLSRASSFLRAIAAYPEIRVVAAASGGVQIMENEQSARELINSYPHLKAIFAVSADATEGAMLALQSSVSAQSVSLIGSDRDLFLKAALQQGKLDSLVTSDPYRIGYLAAEAALSGIRGQPLPKPTRVGIELLTRDGLPNGNH